MDEEPVPMRGSRLTPRDAWRRRTRL